MDLRWEATVRRKRIIAEGVVELRLGKPDGSALPGWEPGSHIDLVLANGLVRQYSLCGRPADRAEYVICVLREPAGRGGSDYIHQRLSAGDTVEVRGPRNHFEFVAAARYLFLAGGIGITPLLPMLRAAREWNAAWTLAYGGRARTSMAYAAELPERYPNSVEVWPQDERGLLPLDRLLDAADEQTAVYCCGPEPLLSAVEEACARRGLTNLHTERFAAKPDTSSVSATEFDVELGRSGRVLRVGARESILEALERAGVPTDSSCREGTCATCETGVLAGAPDHRDSVLTQAERDENKTMMICVSRSRTPRLTLDL